MAILNLKHWFQKRESAITAATVADELRGRYNALMRSDPQDLANAVSAYNTGDLAPLARLIEEYERRDDKMKACSMKMKASIGRCGWSVQTKDGFEGDERAARHADILRRFWSTVRATSTFMRDETGGFNLLKRQMMDAQSYGWSVHELVWHPSADGELRCEFVHVPLWHFENKTGRLRFLKTYGATEGEPMKEGEWMVATGDGIGIAASLCACMKRMGLVDWMIYSERCGMPLLHGSTGAAFGSEQWENLNRAIRNIARYTQILTDASTKVEAIPLGGGSAIPYPQLVEWADRAIAALYRGADLSTMSQGQGGLGASLQGDEADMLEQDACARISDTLGEAVERFVIRYVTGDDEPLAHIVVEPEAKQNVDADIKIDQHLAALGAKLSRNDALQRYGRIEADPDDDADAPLVLSAQPGYGLPNEAPSTKHQAPSTLLAAFAADNKPLADALQGLLKDLETAGDDHRASRIADFLSKLPALVPNDPETAAIIAEEMAKTFSQTPTYGDTALQNAKFALQNDRSVPDGRRAAFSLQGRRGANLRVPPPSTKH